MWFGQWTHHQHMFSLCEPCQQPADTPPPLNHWSEVSLIRGNGRKHSDTQCAGNTAAFKPAQLYLHKPSGQGAWSHREVIRGETSQRFHWNGRLKMNKEIKHVYVWMLRLIWASVSSDEEEEGVRLLKVQSCLIDVLYPINQSVKLYL